MCADVSHRWKIAIEVVRRCERVGVPKREEKRGSFSRDWHEHAIDGLLWSGKKDERERPLKGVHRGLRSGRPHGVVWSAKKKEEKRDAFSCHRQEHAIDGLLSSAKKDELGQEVCELGRSSVPVFHACHRSWRFMWTDGAEARRSHEDPPVGPHRKGPGPEREAIL